MNDAALLRHYRGRTAVITGGLGFIGSNLAIALTELGARVRVLDSLDPQCGGDLANLGACARDVDVTICDIRDSARAEAALRGADTVFNLAADISHTGSMRDPFRDLDSNVTAQLGFLQTCARVAPGIRVVYTSTRQEYGRPARLPVDERHPVAPVDFNGVHKHTAAQYHLLLHRLGLLDPLVLRLTNIYGPRMGLRAASQGFLAAFFREALEGRTLRVYGDGRQRRDPLFIDDAVECLLLAGLVPHPETRILNIGHESAVTLHEIAAALSRIAGLPEPILQPFPPDRHAIDIGCWFTRSARAQRVLGWSARTPLEEGLRATWRFYAPAEPAGESEPVFQPLELRIA